MFPRSMIRAVLRSSSSFSRGFASKPARKMPTLLGQEGRLAQGLFGVAKEDKKLDRVAKDLADFETVLATNAEVKNELGNSYYTANLREEMLDALNKDLKYDPVTLGFLKMAVTDGGGLGGFSTVRRNYDALVQYEKNEVDGKVVSSQPLTKKQLDSITKKLDAFVPEGAKINMTQEVDESLLGGFVVEIGEYQQDLSVRSQIDRLSGELLEVADQA